MTRFNFKAKRRCEHGFLHDYLHYTSVQESPTDFHLWVALSIIASALNRQVWFQREYFTIYPNLFVVLVAESGLLHKSTAINMGVRLHKDALPNYCWLNQKTSPEKMVSELATLSKDTGKAVASVHSSEFSVFFGQSRKDASLIQTLTDLYDCPDHWSAATLSRGEEEIHNCCLSIIAGSTPEWIQNSLPEDSIGGGFMSRMLLINRIETDKEPEAFPEDQVTPEMRKSRENCIHDLQIIASMHGKYTWTKDAKELFRTWYSVHDVSTAPINLRGYFGRKGDFILKLAMLIAASVSDQLIINREHFQYALAILDANEPFIQELTYKMAQTKEGNNIQKILNLIKRAGTIEHSTLLRRVYYMVDKKGLAEIISTLESAGDITVTYKGQKVSYTAKDRSKLA